MSIKLFHGEKSASEVGADITNPLFASSRAMQISAMLIAQAGTTPTLDIAIHAKIGDYYHKLCEFAQFTTTLGMKVLTVKKDFVVTASVAPAANPGVGSAEVLQTQLWLDTLRVAWAIAGTSPVYTFSVYAYPIVW